MQERSIIHLNVTDFAVAVERLCDRSLKGLPVIVAPVQAARGLVYDMSEEAYQDGVRKGMRLSQARKYCHRAHLLSPRPALYRRAMTALVQRVLHYTPLVEQGDGDGHLFMDVTGTHRLFGPPPDVAWRLRRQMQKELGLDPVWSLASSKLVAKVAARLVKPSGEYIVGSGEEGSFLSPLALSLLPGLRAEELRSMADFNLLRIGQLAELSRKQLQVIFQRRGQYLYDASRGRDSSPVLPGKTGSLRISREHSFVNDTCSDRKINAALSLLVHGVGRELRQRKMLGRRMGVHLVYSDGTHCIRQATRKRGSDSDFVLRSLGVTALARAWKRRIRIRSLTLICDLLQPRSRQQTLFSMQAEHELQQERILRAMDAVYSRYGQKALSLGPLV